MLVFLLVLSEMNIYHSRGGNCLTSRRGEHESSLESFAMGIKWRKIKGCRVECEIFTAVS